MSDRRIYFELIAFVVLFGITCATDEVGVLLKNESMKPSELLDNNDTKDHYPLAWTQVDVKTIIDNDRLFKKYKECLTSSHPISCPRMVVEFKGLIPEMIDTLCAKCLPIHIEKFKAAVEYICHRRRADYDQVRREKDPEGAIQGKFEEKFGKVNC